MASYGTDATGPQDFDAKAGGSAPEGPSPEGPSPEGAMGAYGDAESGSAVEAQSAEDVCPPEFKDKDKRAELGRWLTAVYTEGERQKSELVNDRHDRVYALYNGLPPGRGYTPYEGCADENFNLIQPRLDALAGIVTGTVTSKEPYCRADLWEDLYATTGPDKIAPEDVESIEGRLERRVFKALVKADYKSVLKKAALTAGWCNAGHVYIEWDGEKPRVYHKHPTEVVVYPASAECVEDAEFYSVRQWRVKSQIEDMVESGYYFDVDLQPTEPAPQKVIQNMPETEVATENAPEDDLLPYGLQKCFFKKNGTWYGATLHTDSQSVCRLWRYPYKTPCLQKYQYKLSSQDAYWTPGSVGNDLQGFQLTVNELVNMAVDALRASAFPSVGVPDAIGSDNLDVHLSPGDVVPISGLDKAMGFLSNVNLEPVRLLVMLYLAQADQAARISAMAAAAQLRPNTTATEASGVMQGQAESRDDYIETWSRGVEKSFEHTHELLSYHEGEWDLPMPDEVRWSAQSVSPVLTPQGIVQILMQVLQTVMVPGTQIDPARVVDAMLTELQRMGIAVAKDLKAQPQNTNGQAPIPNPLAQGQEAGPPAQTGLPAPAGGQPGAMGGMAGVPPDQVLSGLLGQLSQGGAGQQPTLPGGP